MWLVLAYGLDNSGAACGMLLAQRVMRYSFSTIIVPSALQSSSSVTNVTTHVAAATGLRGLGRRAHACADLPLPAQ